MCRERFRKQAAVSPLERSRWTFILPREQWTRLPAQCLPKLLPRCEIAILPAEPEVAARGGGGGATAGANNGIPHRGAPH